MSAPMRILRSRLLPPPTLSFALRCGGRSPQLRRYASESDGAKDGSAPEKLTTSTRTSSKKKAAEAEAAAPTAARQERRSRPARRPPATFRNLISTDIPILATPITLQRCILRAENNTVTFDDLPYPYSPLTRDELISVCTPLLNANFSLDERFPSFSSRIINLISPYKGSDILLEYLATALAHHTNADFLRITSADLFQRPSLYISHTSRVVDYSDTNGREATLAGSPQSAILSAIRRLERQHGVIPRGIIIGVNQRDDEDSPKLGDIPFPWRRSYGQGWSRRDAPFHLGAPIGSQPPNGAGKDDPLSVMTEIFNEFFHTASESTERPKIIYYADLMELLNLNDAREQILHALAASLPYTRHPILVLAPSTTTLSTHHSVSSNSPPDPLRMGGVIRIAAPFGEEDEDPDDQDIESSTAELTYAHSPAGGYVGVSVVHILPPTTSEARRVLQPLLDRDRRRVVEDANLRELITVCEANGVALVSELRDVLADRSLRRYDRVKDLIAATPARLLGDRLLTPFEIERLVMVAATERRVIEKPVGKKSAGGTKTDANGLVVGTWEIDIAGLARACDIVIRSVMLREAAMANVMATAREEGEAAPQKLSGREQKILRQCLVGAGKWGGL